VLCLLLAVCISEAINDMVGVIACAADRRVPLPFPEPACHWEALCRGGGGGGGVPGRRGVQLRWGGEGRGALGGTDGRRRPTLGLPTAGQVSLVKFSTVLYCPVL